MHLENIYKLDHPADKLKTDQLADRPIDRLTNQLASRDLLYRPWHIGHLCVSLNIMCICMKRYAKGYTYTYIYMIPAHGPETKFLELIRWDLFVTGAWLPANPGNAFNIRMNEIGIKFQLLGPQR